MAQRAIDEILLLDLIDSGDARYNDAARLWIYKSYAGRDDNLLCVAVILQEDALIVKTVMHHFQLV